MTFENDFMNSVAQEDVVFQTQIIRSNVVGDNYFKTMVFVEEDRFIHDDNGTFLVPVPGTNGIIKAGVVTADTYTQYTSGLLLSWLTDLFANSNPYDVYLVTCGKKLPAATSGAGTPADPFVWENLTAQTDISITPAEDTDIELDGGTLTLESADGTIYYTLDGSDPSQTNGFVYSEPLSGLSKDLVIKAVAYAEGKGPSGIATITFVDGTDPGTQIKAQLDTGVAPEVTALSEFNTLMTAAYAILKPYAYHKTVLAGSDTALVPQIAVALSELCVADKDLLSAAPYYPVTYMYPTMVETNDPLVAAIKASSGDAFFTYHSDTTRNGSLYSLGLALSVTNASGTPVGNSIDFVASNMITLPGPNGTALSLTVRDFLKGKNIATFKSVGDNTGNVVARGIFTYRGDVMQANWIVAYVAYMSKVEIAGVITQMNAIKNSTTYARIGRILASILNAFGPEGSGRLNPIAVTLPGFADLPEAAGDEYIIPNAWSGTFIHQTHRVQVTGTLVIPAAS